MPQSFELQVLRKSCIVTEFAEARHVNKTAMIRELCTV